MNTLKNSTHPKAASVKIDSHSLSVCLEDGRTVICPLNWFPSLVHATPKQRNHIEIICRGTGLYWPEIDEDISVIKLVTGHCED